MTELRILSDLLDLQEVDSQIDRLLHQRQHLPELAAYREAHAESLTAQQKVDQIEEALRGLNLELDRSEGELELLEQKLSQEERRLYAGGMSARETENFQREVEALGRKRGEMEEAVLTLLDQKEALEMEQRQAHEALTRAQAAETSLEESIAEQWRVIDGELARREERKGAIIPLISPPLLELYESLRPAKEGVAVGRLADGICGGCHLALSAAERQEALADDPPRCIHCRRILVP